jgi:16S rRNA (guanine(1405)-N(7))-methyltransferase
MHPAVLRILASKKYRALYPPVVERIFARCVERYDESAAESEARSILHQIWGSYYPARPDFKKLWEKLQAEVAAGRRDQAIEMVLRLHTSSAERLPFLDEFYKKIFAIVGSARSIIDHGCCLDPIAAERFGLPEESTYQAFDIDVEEVEFLRKACALLGYGDQVRVAAGDAIAGEAVPADVVFMLKLLPVLEQQQKGSAREVLLKQRAKWLVVSYPVASLSGKEKGMTEFYTNQFLDMVDGLEWEVYKLIFPTELVFVVDTKERFVL